MFCQACHRPLPFKVGGQWYFESVRFVNARQQVHTANAVALCPLCAALYKYTRETRNDALIETVASIEVEEGQGGVEIPLVLNDKRIKIPSPAITRSIFKQRSVWPATRARDGERSSQRCAPMHTPAEKGNDLRRRNRMPRHRRVSWPVTAPRRRPNTKPWHRLHANAWLFRRNTGFDSVHVGIFNVSQGDLLHGLERNVRFSSFVNPRAAEVRSHLGCKRRRRGSPATR